LTRTPLADFDASKPTETRREERRVPRTEPLFVERGATFPKRVEQDLDKAFDRPSRHTGFRDLDPKSPRKARAHGILGELLTFNFTGAKRVFCEARKRGLVALREAECIEPREESAACFMHARERGCEACDVCAEFRPTSELPNVDRFTAHSAENTFVKANSQMKHRIIRGDCFIDRRKLSTSNVSKF
jgi:hypothetical protein